ncbi:MAG: alpha/beta fold hydrolase [bacterium]|nr:alpha/beta fold hydrolase [bacterium]
MKGKETKLHRAKPDGPETGIRADVVFVHGLGGDFEDTWTPKDMASCNFPDLLQKALPDVRVWSLDYPAHMTNWGVDSADMGINKRALTVLSYLRLKRIGQLPVVFICHSLGGILIKKILERSLSLGDAADNGKVFNSTKGVCFLATPHSGSSLANIAKLIDKVFLRLFRRTELVNELKAGNTYLKDLNDGYRQNSKSKKTKAFSEGKACHGIMVVDEESADPGITGCIVYPTEADHLSICKPIDGEESNIYLEVLDFVKETLKDVKAVQGSTTSLEDEKQKSSPAKKAGEAKKEIIQLIRQNISLILKEPTMEQFQHHLNRVLNDRVSNEPEEENTINSAAVMIDILVRLKAADAVEVLDLAVYECFAEIKRSKTGGGLMNAVWDYSVIMVEWIALLGVNEEWERTEGKEIFDAASEEKRLPVKTKAGADIVRSKVNNRRSRLCIDDKSKEVSGEYAIDIEVLESGFRRGDNISTIHSSLLKDITKGTIQKGLSAEDIVVDLKRTLRNKKLKKEHYYIPIQLPLPGTFALEKEDYLQLQRDLEYLEVLFLDLDSGGGAIDDEIELRTALRQFFMNKPGN